MRTIGPQILSAALSPFASTHVHKAIETLTSASGLTAHDWLFIQGLGLGFVGGAAFGVIAGSAAAYYSKHGFQTRTSSEKVTTNPVNLLGSLQDEEFDDDAYKETHVQFIAKSEMGIRQSDLPSEMQEKIIRIIHESKFLESVLSANTANWAPEVLEKTRLAKYNTYHV